MMHIETMQRLWVVMTNRFFIGLVKEETKGAKFSTGGRGQAQGAGGMLNCPSFDLLSRESKSLSNQCPNPGPSDNIMFTSSPGFIRVTHGSPSPTEGLGSYRWKTGSEHCCMGQWPDCRGRSWVIAWMSAYPLHGGSWNKSKTWW